MATLTGQFISQSYGGIIQLSTNTGIVTGSSTQLQDGFGTNLGIFFNGTGSLTTNADITVNNFVVGRSGGNQNTNTAFGQQVLAANTSTGLNNTAMGYQALKDNTTGDTNTAFGGYALNKNTTAGTNTAIGFQSLFSNTVGANNVGVGNSALYLMGGGSGNTAVGVSALQLNQASNNTAIGFNALTDNDTGLNNTAIGANTGNGITTGNYNTILGANVTGLSSSLSNNIILADGQGNIKARYSGSWTLDGVVNTTASYAITASHALNVPTNVSSASYLSGSTAIVENNITVVGGYAEPMSIGFGKAGVANTNIAIGNETLLQTNAGKNIAIGFKALKNTTSGSANNIAIGANALRDMGPGTRYTSGSVSGSNIAIGSDVAQNVANASANIFIGDQILYSTSYGGIIGNTIIGKSAAGLFEYGNYNTYLGFNTGAGIQYGSSNTIIGARVTGLGDSTSNNIILSDGDGNIRARYSGSWTMSGIVNTTASLALNATSASFASNATTASFALAGNFVSLSSNNAYTGNQIYSGSTSFRVIPVSIASSTASLNLASGSFFTLDLSGGNTHITAVSASRGQSAVLQLTQPFAGNATVTFSSTFTFPTGSAFSTSLSQSAVDVVSFVSFNGTSLRSIGANNYIPV